MAWGCCFLLCAHFGSGLFREGRLSLSLMEVVAMSVSSLDCGWEAWRCHISSPGDFCSFGQAAGAAHGVVLQPVANKIGRSFEQ